MKTLPILFALALLTGCAHHSKSSGRPVTAPARDRIAEASTASQEASKASLRSSEHIAAFKTNVERAQAKDEVIRQWEARQAIKHHQP